MKQIKDATASGMADPEKAEERLAICEECPSFQKNFSRCGECGCLMKLKTKLRGASCPLGKW